MRQFLLCLAMLICSIFMYALVTFLEESNTVQNAKYSNEGNIAGFGLNQK